MITFLVKTTYFLVITIYFSHNNDIFLVIMTYFSRNNDICHKKLYVFRYNRYMVGYIMWVSWAIVRSCSVWHKRVCTLLNWKYSVLNVFNVMVLIVAAYLLGLISNLSTIYPITALRPMTCLGYKWSDQNSYFWIIDSGLWDIYLFEYWSLILSIFMTFICYYCCKYILKC